MSASASSGHRSRLAREIIGRKKCKKKQRDWLNLPAVLARGEQSGRTRKEGKMNLQEQARFEPKKDQHSSGFGNNSNDPGFVERVRVNQKKLRSELMRSQYDFIVCGSGSSGSVVAG